jgi:hypothetical protein
MADFNRLDDEIEWVRAEIQTIIKTGLEEIKYAAEYKKSP